MCNFSRLLLSLKMSRNIVLQTIGAICVSLLTYEACYALIYFSIIKPYRRSKIVLKKFGKWAVVTTSANDSLGKEYAYCLAREGMSIALISKNVKQLESYSSHLEKAFHVNTMLLEADLASLGGDPERLRDRFERTFLGMEVGVLVNCLSARSPRPELFVGLPPSDRASATILNCNVAAATHLARLALEGMCARRRGLVLLVCSTAALLPCPLLTVYAASQAYVDKFARDLSLECAPLGVLVECHTPGLIAEGPCGGGLPGGRASTSYADPSESGDMMRIRQRPSWTVPSPRRYAEASLASVGSGTTTPAYTPHCLMVALARLSLWVAPGPTTRAFLRGMQSLRADSVPR